MMINHFDIHARTCLALLAVGDMIGASRRR